jgi:hypothetical protein
MSGKQLLLSPQMKRILEMLEQKGAMTVRQIDSELYRATPARNRRVFAASTSRTLSRMVRRGLVDREGKTIKATDVGLLRIHPEQVEALSNELGKAIRRAVDEAFARCWGSQEAIGEKRNDGA